jgi:hypothetical protein
MQAFRSKTSKTSKRKTLLNGLMSEKYNNSGESFPAQISKEISTVVKIEGNASP